MPPGTEVSTEVTAGIVGLVKSVRVVGVLEGLMEALDISEAGPDGVPPCSVEPSDALSTPELSCRNRFLLNFARAFWNQTCGDKNKSCYSRGEVIHSRAPGTRTKFSRPLTKSTEKATSDYERQNENQS